MQRGDNRRQDRSRRQPCHYLHNEHHDDEPFDYPSIARRIGFDSICHGPLDMNGKLIPKARLDIAADFANSKISVNRSLVIHLRDSEYRMGTKVMLSLDIVLKSALTSWFERTLL